MRRNAVITLCSVVLISSLSGCSLFKKKEPVADTSYDQSNDAAAQDSYTAYPAAGGTYGMSGSKTHTVARKETLYSIARMYYNGDQSRWKEIYEANRGSISDPNKIRVGQVLTIP